MKHILITGSKGYIATNLTNYLSKTEYRINGIDKVYGMKAEFIMKYDYKCDAIIHLAALSGIKSCEDDLITAVRDNISSAFNIFHLSYEKNIPVIFLSSQAAKDPNSSRYAMMKKIIEIQAEILNKECSTDIKVLRLTNVYGGVDYLEKKNTVVKKFIESYKSRKPIIVEGSGDQTRDFIHVDDVCEYIKRCIEMDDMKIDEPVDIGTGVQTSINELARMFNTDNIQYDISSRSVGVVTNVAYIDKAIELFGYKASSKLQEYINERIKDNV